MRRLPPEFLRECFDYDPATGVFRWRDRPLRHFCKHGDWKRWNGLYAQTAAFSEIDKDGYRRGVVGYYCSRTRLWAHHVAWAIVRDAWVPMLDHINGIRSDNRIDNLRPATPRQNQQNKRVANGCGLKGIYRNNPAYPNGTFQARIQVDGRYIYLGSYPTAEEAHAAYAEAAKRHFGEFARAS